MTRPPFEVADIFRRYGQAFRERCGDSLSALQRQVMTAIERCRTAALGGQIEQCDRCGHRRVCYRSCRNRHCPKCQGSARAAWVDQRRAVLLDCPYFHVVFTLPREIAAIALQNRRALYNLLFRAAARTLREIAADPKHLGAEIGFFAVLHTWGSNLSFHPHLHCVVPGGGIAPDGDRWIHCRPGFFLPVRVLSRRFRTLFLDQLERAFRHGRLRLSGALAPLADPAAFHSYLRPLRGSEWVVYSKPPFDGPARVLDYVGRYTHRVALSNDRILAVEDGRVRFRWRDYRHGRRLRSLTLSAEEFMRRFLLHVLPRGFHRIRHCGFLGSCHRQRKLALCRRLLGMPPPEAPPAPPPDYRDRYEELTGDPLWQCPACRRGRMLVIARLPPHPPLRLPRQAGHGPPGGQDTAQRRERALRGAEAARDGGSVAPTPCGPAAAPARACCW